MTAPFVYDPRIGRIIVAAKNGGRLDALRLLAAQIEPGWPDEVKVVTWVPASRDRARRRGFDQGRVIARLLARRHGLRVRRLLVRARGEHQAGAGRVDRLVGPTLAVLRAPPKRVLVVDDVATTGASLSAAAEALRRAGAKEVYGATIAVAGR